MTLANPNPESSAGPELVITRVFDAPRELVWQVFTEAEHLMQWWGPKGFTMRVARLELRPGGVFHYGLSAPAGHEMWGTLLFQEIVAPERLVYINAFSDAEGNLTRHPLSASWPLEVLNSMTLTEQAGQTTLTLVSGPINASAEELATFAAGRESLQAGTGAMYDQLAAYLAQLRAA